MIGLCHIVMSIFLELHRECIFLELVPPSERDKLSVCALLLLAREKRKSVDPFKKRGQTWATKVHVCQWQ